jgi:hypothetical protein
MFTVAWGLVGTAVAVIEGLALVNRRKGDTLSEHVWALLKLGRAARVVLVLFWTWLGIHLFTGGWI